MNNIKSYKGSGQMFSSSRGPDPVYYKPFGIDEFQYIVKSPLTKLEIFDRQDGEKKKKENMVIFVDDGSNQKRNLELQFISYTPAQNESGELTNRKQILKQTIEKEENKYYDAIQSIYGIIDPSDETLSRYVEGDDLDQKDGEGIRFRERAIILHLRNTIDFIGISKLPEQRQTPELIALNTIQFGYKDETWQGGDRSLTDEKEFEIKSWYVSDGYGREQAPTLNDALMIYLAYLEFYTFFPSASWPDDREWRPLATAYGIEDTDQKIARLKLFYKYFNLKQKEETETKNSKELNPQELEAISVRVAKEMNSKMGAQKDANPQIAEKKSEMREEYVGCGDEYNSKSLAAALTINETKIWPKEIAPDWQPSLPGNPNDYLVCIKPNGTIQIGGKDWPPADEWRDPNHLLNYELNHIITPSGQIYAFTNNIRYFGYCAPDILEARIKAGEKINRPELENKSCDQNIRCCAYHGKLAQLLLKNGIINEEKGVISVGEIHLDRSTKKINLISNKSGHFSNSRRRKDLDNSNDNAKIIISAHLSEPINIRIETLDKNARENLSDELLIPLSQGEGGESQKSDSNPAESEVLSVKEYPEGQYESLYKYLNERNLHLVPVDDKGDCLFDAMSEFLSRKGIDISSLQVRMEIANHIADNWNDYSVEIMRRCNMANGEEWCHYPDNYQKVMGSPRDSVPVELRQARFGGQSELEAFTKINWDSKNPGRTFKYQVLVLSQDGDVESYGFDDSEIPNTLNLLLDQGAAGPHYSLLLPVTEAIAAPASKEHSDETQPVVEPVVEPSKSQDDDRNVSAEVESSKSQDGVPNVPAEVGQSKSEDVTEDVSYSKFLNFFIKVKEVHNQKEEDYKQSINELIEKINN